MADTVIVRNTVIWRQFRPLTLEMTKNRPVKE
jgi:hypothetical protein